MTTRTTDDHRSNDRAQAPVEQAAVIFEQKNLRFTDLRRKVFEEIASTSSSVGAYEILDRLAQKGTRLAPISVYRALDALLEAGVVHRLESKNAYFASLTLSDGASSGRPIFMSCETCGTVHQVDGQAIFDAIEKAATGTKFEPRATFVEVSGTCGSCAAKRRA